MKRGAAELEPPVEDEEWDDDEEDEAERLIAEETLVDTGGNYQPGGRVINR